MAEDDPLKEKRAALRRGCTKFLHGHRERSAADTLAELARYCDEQQATVDRYGESPFVQRFEAEVAELLGKPAAVFLPTGTMAQQIALRLWSDRGGRHPVGFHPTAHMELHEFRAYGRLHGLQASLIGPRHRPILAEDLRKHVEPLSVLAVELPAREIGGVLPAWDELGELAQGARERGVRLHMDGARLWECGPHYGRSPAEICAGFDSVYVSFYKGLDGIAGCVLAGPGDFVTEARVWQKRHGGSLFSIYPYVAAARINLARHLPRFPEYRERARGIARALAGVEGVKVAPAEPHINMMHLFLRGTPEGLAAARDRIAEERRLWLSAAFAPADVPGWCRVEIYVGTNALRMEDSEIVEAFRALVGPAG